MRTAHEFKTTGILTAMFIDRLQLVAGQAGRLLHQVQVRKTAAQRAEERAGAEEGSSMAELQDCCLVRLKAELVEAGRAGSGHVTGAHELVPLQALREISLQLPDSTAALGRIEHMTKHRLDLYAETILGVTREFRAARLERLAAQQEEKQQGGSQEDFLPSSPASRASGWKGKAGKTSSGGKKSAYFNQNKSWGWKGGAGAGQKRKAGGQEEGVAKRGSAVAGSAGRGRGGGGGGSMGVPRPRH